MCLLTAAGKGPRGPGARVYGPRLGRAGALTSASGGASSPGAISGGRQWGHDGERSIVDSRKEAVIMQTVRDARNKKIAEMDAKKRIVEIVHGAYKTKIQFLDDGRCTVENSVKRICKGPIA